MRRLAGGAYTCRVQAFDLRLYVALADTMDGCFDTLPSDFQELRQESAGKGAVSMYVRGIRAVAVAFPLCGQSRIRIDNLSHESFHTADTILMDAGVVEIGNKEACAYLTGWVSRMVESALSDFNKRKGKVT